MMMQFIPPLPAFPSSHSVCESLLLAAGGLALAIASLIVAYGRRDR